MYQTGAQAVPALPDGFLRAMEAQLGDAFPAFLKSYDETPCRGARLYADAAPADAGNAVPWCEKGVYLPLDTEAGAGILHEAGAWYMQEPSAMIPAAVLPLDPGDRVLDLCAAPGGKTTQLSQRLADGLLVANEIVPSRAEILSSNVERMGCRNTVVTNASPDALAKVWPEFFDKILVDAPCSGEGMFRRHPETRTEWTPESPALCAKRQTEILRCAYRMLRPGGMMVYSTCTFNMIENEGVLARFREEFPDMEPVPFTLPGIGEIEKGYTHIYPHLVRGEGHFVALLRKSGAAFRAEPMPEKPGKAKKARRADAPAPDLMPLNREQQSLWEAFEKSCLGEKITADGLFMGRAVHVPAQTLPPLKGIRVLRCGIHLGEFRGKVFIPDHALSHALPFGKRIELTGEQAEMFARGESFAVDAPFTGFCAAEYKGFRLGLGKVTDGMLKNHYPKGLRKNLKAD